MFPCSSNVFETCTYMHLLSQSKDISYTMIQAPVYGHIFEHARQPNVLVLAKRHSEECFTYDFLQARTDLLSLVFANRSVAFSSVPICRWAAYLERSASTEMKARRTSKRHCRYILNFEGIAREPYGFMLQHIYFVFVAQLEKIVNHEIEDQPASPRGGRDGNIPRQI